jgi:hypothetical protein
MQNEIRTLRAAAKQSAWFGAKLATMVFAPLCILLWIASIGLASYQCWSFGVLPGDFLAMEVPNHPDQLKFWQLLLGIWLLSLGAAVYAVLISAVFGAFFGAMGQFVARRWRKLG